jgi:predicted DNA-binding transcriptional regulator AlpA
VPQIAKLLGLSRATVYRRVHDHGIERGSSKRHDVPLFEIPEGLSVRHW